MSGYSVLPSLETSLVQAEINSGAEVAVVMGQGPNFINLSEC
ncbi:hypothetical protein D082_33920 [Synechocystis sp. PCC 6714]|nr:hypothetical protein D082_33920 [Synechocystis sp. PCC 6714]